LFLDETAIGAFLRRGQLTSEFGASGQHGSQSDECTNELDADLYRSRAL
jgi:hypothetical protein